MNSGILARADDGASSRNVRVELQDWLGSLKPMEAPTASAPERLWTVDEAASFVGCHRNTIYGASASEALHCHRVGRLKRFTREDLLAWTGGAA